MATEIQLVNGIMTYSNDLDMTPIKCRHGVHNWRESKDFRMFNGKKESRYVCTKCDSVTIYMTEREAKRLYGNQ